MNGDPPGNLGSPASLSFSLQSRETTGAVGELTPEPEHSEPNPELGAQWAKPGDKEHSGPNSETKSTVGQPLGSK